MMMCPDNSLAVNPSAPLMAANLDRRSPSRSTAQRAAVLLIVSGMLAMPLAAYAPSGLFAQQAVLVPSANAGTSLVAADIDGDGLDDLVVGSFGSIDWFPSLGGTSGMGPPQPILTQPPFPQPKLAADFDGDGDIDLLYRLGLDLYWTQNLGAGVQWSSGELVASPQTGMLTLQAVDINNDGKLDLLMAEAFLGETSWSLNTGGSPLFDPPQLIVSTPGAMTYSHGADIDGDGDIDLLARGAVTSGLAWHANLDGAGSFGPENTIDPNFAPENATTADIDGDGDLDVVTSGITGVKTYGNVDGQGSFVLTQVIAGTAGTEVARVADLDNDGDIDVFTQTNSPQGTVLAWFENSDGLGTFGLSSPIGSSASIIGAQNITDLDGDGDLDVVWSGAATSLYWARNELGVPLPDWPTLEGALAGSGPAPLLQGDGDLTPGSVITLSLSGALPGSMTALVVGLSSASVPFKGGLLVPSPDLILAGLPVDGNGDHVLVSVWPSGIPAGQCLWFQHWNSDPGGPANFAASNATLAATL